MKSDFPSAMRSTDNTDHFGFNNQLQKPLRASIKDGYTQIPNLLLEALCCAPLAASEFHIVMLFIRLSFGWFDRETRSRKKTTRISARQISQATGVSLATVRDALRRLRHNKVVICQQGRTGEVRRYGINANISKWGNGRAWESFYYNLILRRNEGYFTPALSKSTAEKPIPCEKSNTLWKNQQGGYGKTNRGDIGFSTPSHAFIPAASMPQGTSKESSKESIKEKDSLHTGGEDSLRRNPFEDEEPLRENDPACVEPNGSDTDTTETTHEHILQNESKLSDVVKKAQPKWGESKRNHVVIDLAEAISDPNTPLDRDDIMRLLATEPPSYVDRGDTWLRRMLAKHAHTSPGPPPISKRKFKYGLVHELTDQIKGEIPPP